jgi:hypothetical protein
MYLALQEYFILYDTDTLISVLYRMTTQNVILTLVYRDVVCPI